MSFVEVIDAAVEQSSGPIGPGNRPHAPRTIRNFFGRAREPRPGPQGFLVEFSGATEVGPHFHTSDQFQVFTGGSGTFYQRHALDALHVHYADAFATYGPFGTDGSPLTLLTLRQRASEFTAYMPDERDKLVRRGRRNLDVPLGAYTDTDLADDESTLSEAIRDDDGLAVLVARCGHGATVALPEAGRSPGEYLWVVSGSIAQPGRADHFVATRSLGWFEGDQRLRTITAGPAGATVLILRFPCSGEVPQPS